MAKKRVAKRKVKRMDTSGKYVAKENGWLRKKSG
jgi:hypothetical protein